MKYTSLLKLGLVAVLALLALSAVAGYPIIPPEAIAGLGMVPLAVGEVEPMAQIKHLIEEQNDALVKYVKKTEGELAALNDSVVELAKKTNRPRLGGPGDPVIADDSKSCETWIDTKSKCRVPVLGHSQALATKSADTPSVGRVLRGLVLGGRADDARELEEERKAMGISSNPGGGFTVANVLAAEWIDLLRANMVLSQAGARTVPMESGTLSLAKLTGDPTVSWHGENASLTDTAATLGQVTLSAKTAVCLVKMSLELSQDSANIEQILQRSITSAMAGAIDSAGLVGVTTNAASAPMTGAGIVNLADRNSVTGIGAPTSWDFLTDGMYELMVDNVPMEAIGAMVAHPAVWKKMRKLKTGITNDNTPLTAPEEVARLRKLWTTAAPLSGGDATAVIADWRDLLFGVRKDIQVRVLQESFLGSNLQVAVLAYARVDFAATRAQSFCTLEGITV